MHVLLDLKVGPVKARRCWTPEASNAFIDRAVQITGLDPFGERTVCYHGQVLMFCQLIAESHIAGHLDRQHGLGWVDVFSCADVDSELVAAAVQLHLLVGTGGRMKVQVLERGMSP